MTRLHIFDMDGTLMSGTSAGMEISRQIGMTAEFRELEHALSSGAIDSPGYAQRAYRMWSALTEHHVAGAFAGAPWLAGIREVWADITARGEHCAVISLSPDFFVTRLRAWGVHDARASVFPAFPFAPDAAFDLTGILLPESKVVIADELCARLRSEPRRLRGLRRLVVGHRLVRRGPGLGRGQRGRPRQRHGHARVHRWRPAGGVRPRRGWLTGGPVRPRPGPHPGGAWTGPAPAQPRSGPSSPSTPSMFASR